MIPFALSTFSCFQFLDNNTLRDLDTSPRLYVYEFQQGGFKHYHFIQEDGVSDPNNLTSREFQYSPSLNGISLNSTPFFYPEENIAANFHANAEMHTFLSPGSPLSTLPGMEYKKCRLHFKQGFALSSSVPGFALSMYVRKNDGGKVYLTSIYDNYQNSSLGVTDSPIIFESAIYNQSVDFEVPDLDFIFSTTDADIVALRNKVFGSSRPTTIFFEYSVLTPENVDSIIVDGKSYVKINLDNVSSYQYDVSTSALDVFVDLHEAGGYITSELKHSRFDIETYLNKYKSANDEYRVEHRFTVNLFNSSAVQVGTLGTTILNQLSKFDNVTYRPVIDISNVDHIEVTCEINVINLQTNVTIKRNARIIIADVAKYDPNSSIIDVSLTVDEITNNVVEQVNQIVISEDTPKILQIEKRVFVQLESLADNLTLLPLDFTTKINANINAVSTIEVAFLKIGALTIPNSSSDKLTFSIPKQAYYQKDKQYFITDQTGAVINYGLITRA